LVDDPGARLGSREVDNMVRVLDITVTNRSNDLVWGLLGANYVHFSVLQEYVAARLGVAVGKYHHFSNNLHAYVEREDWRPEAWLREYGGDHRGWVDYQGEFPPGNTDHAYAGPAWRPFPLVRDQQAFERELPLFVETFSGDNPERKTWVGSTEPFLRDVAVPMVTAFYAHKSRQYRPERWCGQIAADDWRLACKGWLERRANRVKG
jgi:hypothetical protein